MTAESRHPSRRWSLIFCLWLLPLLLDPVGVAGAKDADRELAEQLSASLALVADEGRNFVRARDALAQSRLRNMQRLEESLIRTQEGNALDVRAWRVIGAEYRVRLFEGVLAATDETAAQQTARMERRARQQAELASTRSAVRLRQAELLAAARSLAALSAPPPKGAAISTLLVDVLQEFGQSAGEGAEKAKQGAALAAGLLGKVLPGRVIPPE